MPIIARGPPGIVLLLQEMTPRVTSVPPTALAGTAVKGRRSRGSRRDVAYDAAWERGAGALPRRTCASNSMVAAGVTPSMRAACAKVVGRSAASRWRTSAERPGMAV